MLLTDLSVQSKKSGNKVLDTLYITFDFCYPSTGSTKADADVDVSARNFGGSRSPYNHLSITTINLTLRSNSAVLTSLQFC